MRLRLERKDGEFGMDKWYRHMMDIDLVFDTCVRFTECEIPDQKEQLRDQVSESTVLTCTVLTYI